MQIFTKTFIRIFHLTACLAISCNLDKKVEIQLPAYQSELTVECYLVPGEPYQLFLSRSVAYFSDFSLPDVPNAIVVITHKGVSDTLRYEPFFFVPARKVYNYRSSKKVMLDYQEPYYLYIKDLETGKELFAEDTFIPAILIDSVGALLNGRPDSLSSVIAFFEDPPAQTNYYRLIVSRGSIFRPEDQRSDFLLDDRLFNGKATLATSYRFSMRDTAILTLYHLSPSVFQYFRTVRDAADFATNPLRQPVGVASNIKGGLGIFATLSFDRDTLILRKYYQKKN